MKFPGQVSSTLFNKNGVKILIYKKQATIPITGTWYLFNYNNGKGTIQTVTAGSKTTAVFGSNGKLSVQAGVTSILQRTQLLDRMALPSPSLSQR